MKCLIVSDSHGHKAVLDKMIQQYHHHVDLIIHCGDIEDYAVNYPEMMIVTGNNDIYYDLPNSLILPWGTHRIFVAHGHQFSYLRRLEKIAEAAIANNCDIACFGHTHVAENTTIDGVLLINPGSLWRSRDGRGPSYALLDEQDGTLHVEHIFL